MAVSLNWSFRTGDPDKSRVQRAIATLKTNKFVKPSGRSLKLTPLGEEEVAKIEEQLAAQEAADAERARQEAENAARTERRNASATPDFFARTPINP